MLNKLRNLDISIEGYDVVSVYIAEHNLVTFQIEFPEVNDYLNKKITCDQLKILAIKRCEDISRILGEKYDYYSIFLQGCMLEVHFSEDD